MTEDHERRREARSRWLIYLLLVAVIVVGLSFPLLLRIEVSEEARAGYQAILAVPEGGRVALIADYTVIDAERVVSALLRQALGRGLRVAAVSTNAFAAGSIERLSRAALSSARLQYGHALINLGWREGGIEWLERWARNFAVATDGRDFSGDDLRQHPITQRFRTLDDADLVLLVWGDGAVELADSSRLAAMRRIGLVIAGPIEAEFAGALWREGRLEGLITGTRAVGDYEALVAGRGAPTRYLTAVTLATVFIVALILWSYLSGVLGRRRRDQTSRREGRS